MARDKTNPNTRTDLVAPAPVPETTRAVLISRPDPMVPSQGTPLAGCPTNLDLTTPRGKALGVAAGSPSDVQLGPDGTAVFTATNWLIMPDEAPDRETGEIRQFVRLVLFDRAGRTFRTTSENAPRFMSRVLSLFGPEEWAAGITFRVSARRSAQTGRTYHDMRVLVDEGGEQ